MTLKTVLAAILLSSSAAETPATLAGLIKSHGLKTEIVKPPRGLLRHEYIVPDGPYFQLFDWDMYFMGAALKVLIQKLMWSKKDGTYWNIDRRTGVQVRVKAWTNFVPLWARIATKDQAKRLIEDHLLNPAEYWAENGVRTLSKDEPLYDPKAGYWRGPV